MVSKHGLKFGEERLPYALSGLLFAGNMREMAININEVTTLRSQHDRRKDHGHTIEDPFSRKDPEKAGRNHQAQQSQG